VKRGGRRSARGRAQFPARRRTWISCGFQKKGGGARCAKWRPDWPKRSEVEGKQSWAHGGAWAEKEKGNGGVRRQKSSIVRRSAWNVGIKKKKEGLSSPERGLIA